MYFIRTLPHRHLNPKIVKVLAVAIPALMYAHIFEVWTR